MNMHPTFRRRRDASEIEEAMNGPDLPKWQIGDEIEFIKADGWRYVLTIVGITEAGEYQAMWWNGRGHLFYIMEEGLNALRITGRRSHTAESVAMFRRMLGMDPWLSKEETAA